MVRATGGWFVMACGLTVAGCSVATSSFHDGETAGGAVVGTLGTPPVVPAPSSLPATPPAMGAFLEGPVAQRLGDADRDRAYQAEVDAVSSGQRKSWRGVKGNFGFVVPASAGPDGCRPFTHTIYIGGRPQTGSGSGCPTPEGAWKIAG